MNAADIIAANPEYGYVECRIGDHDGLIGTDPGGKDIWCLYLGDHYAAVRGPIEDEVVVSVWRMLVSSQPGVEFKTHWDDEFAKMLRHVGIGVVKDADGRARAERMAA